MVEAAAGLFAALHELDGGSFDEIGAERAGSGGLGPAINDRLRKASTK
jgi:L-threonylcarbamoyladenylate synthase